MTSPINTPHSLDTFYEATFPLIFRFFFRRTLHKESSEDLTSETFLKFAEQASREWPQHPRQYLYGIAAYVFANHLRRKYRVTYTDRELEDIADEIAESTPDNSPKLQNTEKLRALSQHLPPSQKKIILHILVERLTTKEICMKLRKSEDYVNTTRKRAVKSLRKLIACTP